MSHADDHDHDHAHEAHDHLHGRGMDRKRLLQALALTSAVMLTEVIGGLVSGSLALLSDAGHMLTDAAALILAVGALWISSRPADARRTYGFFRLEVLSAFINGFSLVLIAGFVGYEAIQRLTHPKEIDAGLMFIVAVVGLGANLVSMRLLSHSHNMNVRGAFLHVIGDALSSVGVVIAAVVAYFTGWTLLDPILSIAIAIVIAFSSIRLLRQAVHVLLEGVPEHVDLVEVHTALRALPNVVQVHDLHIWTISHGIHSLSAHLVVSDATRVQLDCDTILTEARSVLRGRFQIDHPTLQIESETFARATEAEEAASHGRTV